MTREEALTKAQEIIKKMQENFGTEIIAVHDFSFILPIDMPNNETLFTHIYFDDAYGQFSRGY